MFICSKLFSYVENAMGDVRFVVYCNCVKYVTLRQNFEWPEYRDEEENIVYLWERSFVYIRRHTDIEKDMQLFEYITQYTGMILYEMNKCNTTNHKLVV